MYYIYDFTVTTRTYIVKLKRKRRENREFVYIILELEILISPAISPTSNGYLLGMRSSTLVGGALIKL